MGGAGPGAACEGCRFGVAYHSVFFTSLAPRVVRKVHAVCDYVSWCDVAAQPVPELSLQAKRRMEARTVRIVAPRPPPAVQPPMQPSPVVSDIRLPPGRGAADPTPLPRLRTVHRCVKNWYILARASRNTHIHELEEHANSAAYAR